MFWLIFKDGAIFKTGEKNTIYYICKHAVF